MIANEQNFRRIVSGNDAVPSQIMIEILASKPDQSSQISDFWRSELGVYPIRYDANSIPQKQIPVPEPEKSIARIEFSACQKRWVL